LRLNHCYRITAWALALLAPATACAGDGAEDELFAPQAWHYLRTHRQPTPLAFLQVTEKYLEEQNDPEQSCSIYNPRRFMLDLDGDGKAEGLLLYTIEGCGGGNGWTVHLDVFVHANGKWALAQPISLGGDLGGVGRIAGFRPGEILLGEEDEDPSNATPVPVPYDCPTPPCPETKS